MAVPALKKFLGLFLLLALALPTMASPVLACFGPKLYLGVPATREGEVLAELVALYVKEKTGVESVLVPLEGKELQAEIDAARLDLGVAMHAAGELPDLLAIVGLPALLSGPRPLNDLQFTTVVPALHKLAELLDAETFAELVHDVAAGEPPKARVRRLLMERAWI